MSESPIQSKDASQIAMEFVNSIKQAKAILLAELALLGISDSDPLSEKTGELLESIDKAGRDILYEVLSKMREGDEVPLAILTDGKLSLSDMNKAQLGKDGKLNLSTYTGPGTVTTHRRAALNHLLKN